jgi:phage major head subunit gpT-like protein
MFTNATQTAAAAKNYTGVFYRELENNPAPSWLALVFYFLLSSFKTEVLAFTKGFPMMREWLGERRIQSLSEYSISITKKDYELTVGLNRDEVFFDKIGIIADQIRGIAAAVPRHFIKFFVDLCTSGNATTCYDGQNFFDAAHPNGSVAPTTFSNVTANAFSATEWENANIAAAKIKNPDNGAPLLVRWTHIFFGPNAWVAVNKLFSQRTLATGEDNIYANAIPESNRIQVQEFGNTAKWYLFDLGKILKPFVLLLVKGLDFAAFDRPQDWVVFSTKDYVYGIDTMDNAGFLLPELAYGSTTA